MSDQQQGEPEPRMKDLFGEDSDDEQEQQQQQQQPPHSQEHDDEKANKDPISSAPSTASTSTPSSPLRSAVVSATEKDLFGSDSELSGDEGDADVGDEPDPYRTRGVSELEQQLAGFEDDEQEEAEPVLNTPQQQQQADQSAAITSSSQEEGRSDKESVRAKGKETPQAKRDGDRKKITVDDDKRGRETTQTDTQSSDEHADRLGVPEDTRATRTVSPLPSKTQPRVLTASGPSITLTAQPIPAFSPRQRLYLVRLPNVIGIDSNPFSADTYVKEETAADDDTADSAATVGQGAFLEKNKEKDNKYKATSGLLENVIRCREVVDEHGNRIKQSNTRLVKWSDGTQSLFIGKECFDIVSSTLDHYKNYVYAKHKGYKPTANTTDTTADTDVMEEEEAEAEALDAEEEEAEAEEEEEENERGEGEEEGEEEPSRRSHRRHRRNHQRSYPFLHSMSSFLGHLNFKVTDIESESHRKLKEVLFEHHTKKARIARTWEQVDPEKIRAEHEQLAKKQESVKRKRERQLEQGMYAGIGRRGMMERSDVDFFEDNEYQYEHSTSSSGAGGEGKRRRRYDDDVAERRLASVKAGDMEDEEDEDDEAFVAGEDEEEEEDEEEGEEEGDEGETGEDETAEEREQQVEAEAAPAAVAAAVAAGEGTDESKKAEHTSAVNQDAADAPLPRHATVKKRRVLADDEDET